MIYAHVASGLLGAIIASLGVWQVQDWRYNARISQMQEAYEVSLRKSTEAARVQEQALTAAKQKAQEAYAIQKRKSDAAVLSTRAELNRLREELYAIPPPGTNQNSTAPTRVNGATIERQILGECATALVEVAANADRLATQVLGLQLYVANVCVK